jgi:hypothetical protein
VNQSDGWKFWRYAPADLKWIAIGVPVLLLLWLHPFAKSKTGVEPVAGKQSSFENMFTARWENLRQNIANRAGVVLEEDFHSGLGSWEGKGAWAKSWSYDAAGLVRPGQLALYRPSVGLSDYSFEFLGMIEKRGMGWAFRASDLSNYYGVRLNISKPGPLPVLAIERWAVVNGKEKGRRTVPLPIAARNEMLCRVRMEVQGTSFRVSLQGQVVDAWSDELLAAGGIGFFTVRGDQARIHSVNITHQNDTLGQLCAFLAPYPLQSSSGSWK